MWRDWTTHKHKETMFLVEAKDIVLADVEIVEQAKEVLEKVETNKTLVRLFKSLNKNDFVLRLAFLYAIVGGKIHLADIEELKRDKVFFGEIDEAEETIKEKAASLEVFILAHELGKLETDHLYSHQIVKKEYREVLAKLAKNFRLSEDDTEDVFHLIILHEKIVADFSQSPNKVTYNYLEKYCQKHGRDADDFLDLLLVAIFFVAITDAELLSKVFLNFLSAERQGAPTRGEARRRRQAERVKKQEQIRWRQAELDGESLMKLLGMKPGPEFGKILMAIQAFAKGEGELPELSAEVRAEVMRRLRNDPHPLAPSPGVGRGR